jgi:Co/Zn/Cd efflux system component
LQITCASFLIFVIAEIIGAIAANSWSLLGDAAAMSVDVMTYFTNMVAEHIKDKYGYVSKRVKMYLEVAIPLCSVTALMGVTAYVTQGAVSDIINKPADDAVDIFMLWFFSSANAVVDIISGYMFYAKGRSVFYEHEHAKPDERSISVDKNGNTDIEKSVSSVQNSSHEPGLSTVTSSDSVKITDNAPKTEQKDADKTEEPAAEHRNLNMISAFTHVGGDTLRTISVFIAALIATVTNIPGYLCDAWAAVLVTVTIVIMVIPLCIEIYYAYHRISALPDDDLATAGLG